MMDIHFWSDDYMTKFPGEAVEMIESYEGNGREIVVKQHVVSRRPAQFEISSPDIDPQELEELEREAIREYHALNRSRSNAAPSRSDTEATDAQS